MQQHKYQRTTAPSKRTEENTSVIKTKTEKQQSQQQQSPKFIPPPLRSRTKHAHIDTRDSQKKNNIFNQHRQGRSSIVDRNGINYRCFGRLVPSFVMEQQKQVETPYYGAAKNTQQWTGKPCVIASDAGSSIMPDFIMSKKTGKLSWWGQWNSINPEMYKLNESSMLFGFRSFCGRVFEMWIKDMTMLHDTETHLIRTVQIDGNIGACKSTLVEFMASALHGKSCVVLPSTPSDIKDSQQWPSASMIIATKTPSFDIQVHTIEENVRHDEDLFLKYTQDRKKYGLKFQISAMRYKFGGYEKVITEIDKYESQKKPGDAKTLHIVMFDRSPVGDAVFFRMLVEEGCVGANEEKAYYKELGICALAQPEYLYPHCRIYLYNKIEQCLENIKARNRKGEAGITLDYLSRIEKHHDGFFFDETKIRGVLEFEHGDRTWVSHSIFVQPVVGKGAFRENVMNEISRLVV